MSTPKQLELQYDPALMELTPGEVERAWQIRHAVESDEELHNLSDYEYVQYALVTRDENIPKILQRVEAMQGFRKEYQSLDNPNEGILIMDAYTKQHPGVLLALDFMSIPKTYASVNDWAQFIPAEQITTPAHLRIYMLAMYYMYQCKTATFHAIRQGMSCMIECQGAGWRNFDADFNDKMNHHLFQWYPIHHKEAFFLNSPSVVNMAFSLWKKYIAPRELASFHLGYQVPGLAQGERVDILYKIPTAEAARETMLIKIHGFLQLRYKYQREYRLPPEEGAQQQEEDNGVADGMEEG